MKKTRDQPDHPSKSWPLKCGTRWSRTTTRWRRARKSTSIRILSSQVLIQSCRSGKPLTNQHMWGSTNGILVRKSSAASHSYTREMMHRSHSHLYSLRLNRLRKNRRASSLGEMNRIWMIPSIQAMQGRSLTKGRRRIISVNLRPIGSKLSDSCSLELWLELHQPPCRRCRRSSSRSQLDWSLPHCVVRCSSKQVKHKWLSKRNPNQWQWLRRTLRRWRKWRRSLIYSPKCKCQPRRWAYRCRKVNSNWQRQLINLLMMRLKKPY